MRKNQVKMAIYCDITYRWKCYFVSPKFSLGDPFKRSKNRDKC